MLDLFRTKRGRRAKRPIGLSLERLEARQVLAVVAIPAGNSADLISAIITFDQLPGPNTIQLAAGSTYSFGSVDNSWFGPNYLPIITGNLTIEGNGASLVASGSANARFFFVSGGNIAGGPPAGTLSLQDLTISGGRAVGGNSNIGGGGMGAGGAIFNLGTLNLSGVTMTSNVAQGGTSTGNVGGGYGGGGIGTDSIGDSGGGNFGANWPNPGGNLIGGAGGASGDHNGGGGGGFTQPGGAANSLTGGVGGGNSGLGGTAGVYSTGEDYSGGGAGGDGGGGAGGAGGGKSVGGNAFGGGGNEMGGGGVGGGGGGQSGGGGFGGGGGANGVTGELAGTGLSAGGGGFGGGGGGADVVYYAAAGPGGFGGGGGGQLIGGGGAGMGGAIFNLYGTVNITNSTFNGNQANGGAGGNIIGGQPMGGAGAGYGGAIFNLDGSVSIVQGTFSGDSATTGASEIYNLSYGATPSGVAGNATLSLTNSIVSGSTSVLINNQTTGSALVVSKGVNLVNPYQALGGATRTGPRFLTQAPNLGALKDNGGLVPTMALLKGSPAIDAGSNAVLAASTRNGLDARGAGFRRFVGKKVDLGAFEYQPPATSTTMVARTTPYGADRAVVFLVRVAGKAARSNTATGTVNLVAGDRVIAAQALDRGVAQFNIPVSTISTYGTRFRAVFTGLFQNDATLGRSISSLVNIRRNLAGR
ncbi:choice-of-anchor Q domain-containing protein [Isosphaeraceae bacterium EP7]